ncbi:secreted RxLR effector protein 161-like [Vigna umbellata]|uniref:secreted RxLR effector protein 161-like n=1 Tax=Vigna umbellata TaxID=87088 RepID=UPI001F5F037E|nr:secreted RxLR effector protein 161-like [Vigna umbellata]
MAIENIINGDNLEEEEEGKEQSRNGPWWSEVVVLHDPYYSPVGVVSQFMQNPHVDHWNAVIRILRYVKRNRGHELLYEDKGSTRVEGYCDVDWAGCPIDRRSIRILCFNLKGNLVSLKVKNKVLLLIYAEAEYRSMALT